MPLWFTMIQDEVKTGKVTWKDFNLAMIRYLKGDNEFFPKFGHLRKDIKAFKSAGNITTAEKILLTEGRVAPKDEVKAHCKEIREMLDKCTNDLSMKPVTAEEIAMESSNISNQQKEAYYKNKYGRKEIGKCGNEKAT